MSKDKQKLIDLGEEVEKIQRTFPELVREGSERWKSYMDSLADIFENWHQQKSIWATTLRFVAMKYGNEFEVELPDDYKSVPFLINVDAYPKEGNDKVWTFKIDVIVKDNE